MNNILTRFRRHGSHSETAPGESQLLQPSTAREVLPPDYDMHPAALATAETETFAAPVTVRPQYETPALQFRGGGDTQAEREGVAAIFGPGAHGVATQGTLDAIAEQARQASARNREVRREAEDATRADMALIRPYSPPPADDPTVGLRPAYAPPASAMECYFQMTRVLYPRPGTGSREQWAAALQQVGAATGTRTRWESENAWPSARTLVLAPITVQSVHPAVQHAPLLALPAGTEAAA